MVFNASTDSITVPITIINDTLAENEEAFTVLLYQSLDVQGIILDPAEAIINIIDNDCKHSLTHSLTLHYLISIPISADGVTFECFIVYFHAVQLLTSSSPSGLSTTPIVAAESTTPLLTPSLTPEVSSKI